MKNRTPNILVITILLLLVAGSLVAPRAKPSLVPTRTDHPTLIPSLIQTSPPSLEDFTPALINNYRAMLLIQSDLDLVYELIGRVDAGEVQGGYANGIIVFWINYINNILLQNTPPDAFKNRWQDLSMVLQFVRLFNPYTSPGDNATGVVVFWIEETDHRLHAMIPQGSIKADWQAALEVHSKTITLLNQWINHQVESSTVEKGLALLSLDIGILKTKIEKILLIDYGIDEKELLIISAMGRNNTRLSFILATPTPAP